MTFKTVVLVALCALSVPRETICVHPTAGESRRVSLEEVGKAQAAVKEKFVGAFEMAGTLSVDTPFDSGLPACGLRSTRSVRTDVPRELVGKTIGFGPADRLPDADIRVATSARKLTEIQADGMADPALVERLSVRCAPTIVRAVSEVELELVENP
jgi:hypothetical protein